MENTSEFEELEKRLAKLLVKAIKNDHQGVFLGICSAGVDYVPRESMARILTKEVPALLNDDENSKMVDWINRASQAMTEAEDSANI